MKRYKFITIGKDGDLMLHGRPVFIIRNNNSSVKLGMISYDPPWRQYVFSAADSESGRMVFSVSCLRDIIDFIKTEIPKEIR